MSISPARRLPLISDDGLARGEAHHRTKGLLRITMACNERCPFCNVPVEDYARPTPPPQELEQDLLAFLASGEKTLTISGGEPTLYRERLLGVVARAKSAGVPWSELQTNAVLIDPGYAAALSEAGLSSAFVSLLSDLAPLHDELSGLPGAFDKCLAGIDALLDAGITVTLNPVIASQTQSRVTAYVDFVASRLPRVRSISLSAVQPHGRAASQLELMPDYAVLGPEVRRARERAKQHQLELLNPYCGLPLCVGWEAHFASSVEAIEAAAARSGGAQHVAHGVHNRGNKRHGEPCLRCALRTRCGGAWHAYFFHRKGSGLAAPLERREPWDGPAADPTGQTVVVAREGVDDETLAALRKSSTPTLWLLAPRLRAGDGVRLRDAGVTDLALRTQAPSLLEDQACVAELRAIAAANATLDPQLALRVCVGFTRLGSFRAAFDALRLCSASGVECVRLLVEADERHARFVAAAKSELGLEVSVLEQRA